MAGRGEDEEVPGEEREGDPKMFTGCNGGSGPGSGPTSGLILSEITIGSNTSGRAKGEPSQKVGGGGVKQVLLLGS